MEKVIKFKTQDGKLFDSTRSAELHEAKLSYCMRLVDLLGGYKKDPDCDFSNGNGFYQLTKEVINEYEREFVKALKYFEPDIYKMCFEKHEDAPDSVKANSGFLGRVLSDSNTPFYSPFCKRMCVDSSNRLWGQPYFANHPNQGKRIDLGLVEVLK